MFALLLMKVLLPSKAGAAAKKTAPILAVLPANCEPLTARPPPSWPAKTPPDLAAELKRKTHRVMSACTGKAHTTAPYSASLLRAMQSVRETGDPRDATTPPTAACAVHSVKLQAVNDT